MKKIILIIFCFFMFSQNCEAISAKSYIVMDMDTKQVLYGSNIHDSYLIASISKIMTCIIAIEKGNLNEKITVDEDVLKAIGSSIYIEVGEQILLKDLLYGMMLRSGNDAAIIIAKNISGSMEKFALLMNEYAKKIGMKNTFFYNSHGLEEKGGNGNKSSTYDMALLTSYAMQNKVFRQVFSTENYIAKSNKKTYTWHNKNKLLKYDYITGGKTGYTIKAHRTLVTTGSINKINVVIVTIQDSNDWEDHLTLYKNVNKMYKNVNIIAKKDFEINDANFSHNDKLYIKDNIKVVIKKTDQEKLRIKYYLLKKKTYFNKEIVGYIGIYIDDELIRKEPIFIKISKKKKGIF